MTTTYDWNTDHQLLAIHYPGGTSPALVEATRQVSKEMTSSDPLPPAVERFLETATELLGAEHAATLTVRTFGEMAGQDRTTVATIVFGKRS